MNMQKIMVGQVVLHQPTNTVGEVIEATLTEAVIRVADYKEGELISSVDVKHPKSELTIINVEKEEKLNMKNFKMKISGDIQNITKEMVALIFHTSANLEEFLQGTEEFLEKVEDARVKESKVEFPTTELETTIAIADALTDTNYFVNGSFVELGEAPLRYATTETEISVERYPLENRLFHQVAEFHEVGGHPVASEPTALALQRIVDRNGYTVEELIEFLHAFYKEEFNEQVDLLVSSIQQETNRLRQLSFSDNGVDTQGVQFVVLNTINYHVLNLFKAFRLPSVELADIVHNANMTKFYINEKGEYYAKRRESDNKILKSPNFEAPEPHIRKLIEDWLAN